MDCPECDGDLESVGNDNYQCDGCNEVYKKVEDNGEHKNEGNQREFQKLTVTKG